MLLMGDEVRRTQHGNNNAYCQDNEISWFDWTLLERYPDLHRFVKILVAQRRLLGNEPGVQGVSLSEILREAHIQVHGIGLNRADVSPHSHSLAVTVRGPGGALLIHAMFNAYWEPLTFEIPRPTPGVLEGWRRWIDTYRDAPDDVCDWTLAPHVPSLTYAVQPRSLVTLIAHSPRRPTHAGGHH
jgi:glycogen operon protein